MVRVQEATIIPNEDGGEVKTNLLLGRQEVSTTWPLDHDDDLKPLLDRLMVQVRQVTYISSPGGSEIRAEMAVGDRVFVSRVPVAAEDEELQFMVDQLLAGIGQKTVRNLQAALAAGDST